MVEWLTEHFGSVVAFFVGIFAIAKPAFILRVVSSVWSTYRNAAIQKRMDDAKRREDSAERRELAVSEKEKRVDAEKERANEATQRLYLKLEEKVEEYGEDVKEWKARHRECEAELKALRTEMIEVRRVQREQAARIEYIHDACPNCPNRALDHTEG